MIKELCKFCTFAPDPDSVADWLSHGATMFRGDIRKENENSGREVGLRLSYNDDESRYFLELDTPTPNMRVLVEPSRDIDDVGGHFPVTHCPCCGRELNHDHVVVCYPSHECDGECYIPSWRDYRTMDEAKAVYAESYSHIDPSEIFVFKLRDAIVIDSRKEFEDFEKSDEDDEPIEVYAISNNDAATRGLWVRSSAHVIGSAENGLTLNFNRVWCFPENKRISL